MPPAVESGWFKPCNRPEKNNGKNESIHWWRIRPMYRKSTYVSVICWGRGIICAHKSGSSAHTATDHLRTQISIICAHRSGSCAHTHQNTNPKLLCGLGWGGVGWGGDNNKTWRLTQTWGHITLVGCSVVSNLLMGGSGRGGVGWGGVGTITNLAALHGPEDYAGRLLICINIFLFLGVGWGP